MNRALLSPFLLASLITGCAITPAYTRVSTPLHTTSRAKFEPAQRRAVWGRAVDSFQITGSIVKISDPLGGVLLSEAQPSSQPCTFGIGQECRSEIIVQFTMTDDGMATLRINRGVTGRVWQRGLEVLVSPDEISELQSQCDAWLQYIIGASSKPPTAPPPPPTTSMEI
jgi:hypothetical protein